jgi:hypothetical protein
LVDESLDLPLAVVLRLIEPALDGLRNADARIRDAGAEDFHELIDVHLRAGFAQVLEVGGLVLGGVAHARDCARMARRHPVPMNPGYWMDECARARQDFAP